MQPQLPLPTTPTLRNNTSEKFFHGSTTDSGYDDQSNNWRRRMEENPLSKFWSLFIARIPDPNVRIVTVEIQYCPSWFPSAQSDTWLSSRFSCLSQILVTLFYMCFNCDKVWVTLTYKWLHLSENLIAILSRDSSPYGIMIFIWSCAVSAFWFHLDDF